MVIDQCLFGYEDGHRLLASSMQLGDELSELTELSDLAPGVVFSGSDGYWTGVPAPKIGRYALMRTWTAPEMSRPGCVWTHVLLLEPSILENVPDLSALVRLFNRPNGLYEQSQYREQLTFDFELYSSSQFIRSSFDSSRVLRDLLVTLYSTGQFNVSVLAPEEADAPLFALWSQQWPRLRRNFRFQTAVSRGQRSPSVGRFDIYLQLENSNSTVALPASTDWVEAALEDVMDGPRGGLRSFLWKYGSDVRKQRGSFRPLVNVQLLHQSDSLDAGPSLLKLITEAFPDASDAVALKQDIIDGILVPHAQLDVFWFVIEHDGAAVFPSPSTAGVSRLAQLWPDRPEDLLHLAERTAVAIDELGRLVFEAITGAVPTEEFWSLTKAYPRVRERMVAARPELLSSEAALTLDNGTLLSFLRLVASEGSIGQDLIPKVLVRDDSQLVDMLIERYPQAVALEVISALNGGSVSVGAAWMRGLIQRPNVLLDSTVMARIGRTSLIFELAERLGWLSESVVAAGTQPWVAAIATADKDLPDDKRETLNAFLVGLALLCGGDGGRLLLEQFFDGVHELIIASRLPWRASSILAPCLPTVSWGRGWDVGLRLRLAVAAVYVRNGYSSESYAVLSKSKKVRTMLSKAAAEVNGAERLV